MTKVLLVPICMAMTLFAHAEKETPFMFSIWPSRYTQFPGGDGGRKLYGDDCSVYGFRLAPGFGVAENVYGLDVSGYIGGVSNEMNGVQLSFGGMICFGEVNGVQIGRIAVCSNLDGAQIGELALAIEGDVNGVQLGGIVSGVYKGTLRGVQLSGVYSGATALKGLQIGSINYVGNDFCGVQLGVVNISLDENKDSNKLQIGLINYMTSAAVKCLPIVNMSF